MSGLLGTRMSGTCARAAGGSPHGAAGTPGAHPLRRSPQCRRQGQHRARAARASRLHPPNLRPPPPSSPPPRCAPQSPARPRSARAPLHHRGSRSPGVGPARPPPGPWGSPRATDPRPGCICYISCPAPTSSSVRCPAASRPKSRNTSRWERARGLGASGSGSRERRALGGRPLRSPRVRAGPRLWGV